MHGEVTYEPIKLVLLRRLTFAKNGEVLFDLLVICLVFGTIRR